MEHHDKQAHTYQDRIAAKKAALQAAKVKRAPVGFSEPIPEGKLSSLLEQPQAENPPQGVGGAMAVNQAVAQSKKPLSLAEAERAARKMNEPPKTVSDETLELMKKAKEETEKSNLEKELDKAEEEIAKKNMPFDFDAIGMYRDDLMSDERRKAIEEGLEEMEIGDLVVKREIQQTIKVVKGLSITVRTFNQAENLFCLRLLYEYPGSPGYQEEVLSTFKMVCSLLAINGAPLPDHRENVGKMDEEVNKDLFLKKMQLIASYPVHLIADMGIQVNWLSDRVKQLFSVENLKNG